jgi:hypothetical protein
MDIIKQAKQAGKDLEASVGSRESKRRGADMEWASCVSNRVSVYLL